MDEETEDTPTAEVSDHITLPIGIEKDGVRHRNLVIDELGGVDQELASNKKKTGGNGAKALSLVLCRAIQEIDGLVERKSNPERLIDRNIVRGMYQADRDFVISRIQMLAGNDETTLNGQCGKCGERHEEEVLLSELPVTEWPTDKPTEFAFTLPRGYAEPVKRGKPKLHQEGIMRFARGSDQEAVSPIAKENKGRAMTAMLAACITKLGDLPNVDTDVVRRLKNRDRSYLFRAIRDNTPGLRQWREVSCVECGASLEVVVDLSGFFD